MPLSGTENAMHYLFEPVALNGKPLLLGAPSRTTDYFAGFYHWHQCCEVLLVHEGTGHIIVNQKTYEMKPGRLFVFQPYQLHKVSAAVSPDKPYVRTILFLHPRDFDTALRPFPSLHAVLEQLWRSSHTEPVIDLHADLPYLEQLIARYHNRPSGEHRMAEEENMTLLLLQLLEAISRRRHIPERMEYRMLTHSEQAMQWIETHYASEIGLDDIAEALHLSKFYLSRLFRNETGSSLSDYLTARRIKQACRLLYTSSYSVEHIAAEVGYPNASYFIRTFKKTMGITPLQYRKSAQKAEE